MRSGFVALAGRPNAGKSTLINNLIGEKIAIVSSKPQTTRSEIRGIYTDKNCQIVFTDTPGIHKPKVRLETRMNKEAADVIQGVDLIYLVVDGSKKFGPGDQYVLDMVKNGTPITKAAEKASVAKSERSGKKVVHQRAGCQQMGDRPGLPGYQPAGAGAGGPCSHPDLCHGVQPGNGP